MGVNEEVCFVTMLLVTSGAKMLLVTSGFLCRMVLVYPTTYASGMEDCGGLKLWGMNKLACGASVARTGLVTIIFYKPRRMDGS